MTDSSSFQLPQDPSKIKVKLTLDLGLRYVYSVIFLLWWFIGVAVAPWFWWKVLSFVPPVGMAIAVDKALNVYVPQMIAPVIPPKGDKGELK